MPGAGEKPLVLVADDERHVTRLLQVNLERGGYLVAIAHDGVEVVEQMTGDRAIAPAAIVLDHLMPRMDGYEVMAWLNESGWGGIPVMFMTTQDCSDFVGPYGHKLVKPFNPRHVVEWVRLVTGVGYDPSVA